MDLENQQERLLDSMEIEDLEGEMQYVSQPLSSQKSSNPWAPFLSLAIYAVVTIATALSNHSIFSVGNVYFPYPLILTWFELAFSFVFLTLGSEINALLPPHRQLSIPQFEFEWQTVKSIFPIGLFHAMVLTSAIYCLQFMDSSLYSITRSLSVLFTIVFCMAILKYRIPPVLCIAALIAMFGYAMIQSSQAVFTVGGLFTGIVSSILTGLYFVYLKSAITLVNNDVWKLFQYHTILSIFFLIIPILISGELDDIANNAQWAHEYNVRGWVFLTAFLGFLIQAATLNALKVTNPVAFIITVALKHAIQSCMSNWIYSSPLYGLDIFGITLTLIGVIAFGYISTKTPIIFQLS